MQTEPGSECGISDPVTYTTVETKACPTCGLRVRESYTAEVLTEGRVDLPEIKIQ